MKIKLKKRSLRYAMPVIGVVALIALILYMGGFFAAGRIRPGKVVLDERGTEPKTVARSSREKIKQWYEAVGTVRSRTEANVSAQITGRILQVTVRPGDKVGRGQVLIYLDDRELQARLGQARNALEAAQARRFQADQELVAAQAQLTQAEANYRRIKKYLEQNAATPQQMEDAEAKYQQAKAGVEQARQGVSAATAQVERTKQAVREAEIALGYTKVAAEMDGVVARRLAEPGDLAWPGKSLLVIHDPASLRLEANVREGLIGKAKPGSQVRVVIDAISADVQGRVDEIVPSADPRSRTFLVKVSLPSREGLYPGMFGRLLVPLGEREVVLAPAAAIHRVGQLETVLVEKGGRWTRRYVRTGERLGGRVEILSGLDGSERVALMVEEE